MAWSPQRYRIRSGLIDVRGYDDSGVAFVRKTIERIQNEPMDTDDLEYQLRSIANLGRDFAAELLLVGNGSATFVARFRSGALDTRAAADAVAAPNAYAPATESTTGCPASTTRSTASPTSSKSSRGATEPTSRV